MYTLLIAGALAIAAGAQAAATPVSPANGAVILSSHPLFVWSVPVGEVSRTIQIARSPQTTPSGKFFDENVVTTDFFDNEATTRWSPTSQLYAGSYWWSVGTRNEDYDSFYSFPWAFKIPAIARITSIRFRRTSYTFFTDELDTTVRWTSNTRNVSVTVNIARLGRRLYRARQNASTYEREVTFNWEKSRLIRQGVPLRVTVALRAGTAVRTAVRTVRAP